MKRVGLIVMLGAFAAMAALFVLGWANSPVQTRRSAMEAQLAQLVPPDFTFGTDQSPEYEAWQRAITSQPKLWEPLLKPQAAPPPPPNLAEALAGVVPTRNEVGSGANRKVQIQVEGRKDWYTVGQQVKGCAIREITDTAVLFTVIQGGQEYGIALPRR
ncbi:MAG: hypothetical protein IT364_23975 [Candidatus Hydrogenedentes bacterium]|nr:hypothetical protein [Candidatus Hydrogenedentota bacterium]